MAADLANLPWQSCEYPVLSAMRPCAPCAMRPRARTGTDGVRICLLTWRFRKL